MRYEIRKSTREIDYKNRKEIKKGCTLDQRDQESEAVNIFDSKDEALSALKNYKSDIQRLSGGAGTYYLVTEYYVESVVYADENEYMSDGDIWAFSEMPEFEDQTEVVRVSNFKIERAKEIAEELNKGEAWDEDLCAELCILADMEEEYDASDEETIEQTIYLAAAILGVDGVLK